MSDGDAGRVSRKAPRFFGLPEDEERARSKEPVEAGIATDAPTPLRPEAPDEGVRDAPPDDPQAADTAELLVDPVARREVGAIVEARHLLADARELLRQQAMRRVPRGRPANADEVELRADGSDVAQLDAEADPREVDDA